jgi:hypothetical protein
MVMVTLAVYALIEWLCPRGPGGPPDKIYSWGGYASIAFLWMSGSLGAMDLGIILPTGLLIGAIAGMWSGWMVTLDDHSVRRPLIGAATGFLFGGIVSGMMIGAELVVLLSYYDLAWNAVQTAQISASVWGICGALIGLILAAMVHGLTGEKSMRRKRWVNGLAVAAIPILLASCWTVSYVRTKDQGRDLLARADRLDGQGSWVGLGCGIWNDQHPAPANTVIRVGSDKPIQRRERDAYRPTIAACDELLKKYPASAFRSAAMAARFHCESWNWQPREAIDTWKMLQAEFPDNRFDGTLDKLLLSADYAAIGDYQEVLNLSDRRRPSPNDIYAAAVLGKWDDVVRLNQAMLNSIDTDSKTKRGRKKIAEYKQNITQARDSKAKGIGPMPRTDISGAIVINGRPGAEMKIGIVRADRLDPTDSVSTATDVARRSGLLGTTDRNGTYRIPQAPSGEYEIVVVLDGDRFKPVKYDVQAKGIPFRASGGRCTAPTVSIEF